LEQEVCYLSVLLQLGCEVQAHHVYIRDSSHCFLSEEECSTNRAPVNKSLMLGPLLCINSFFSM
jgi:hypothetical protein